MSDASDQTVDGAARPAGPDPATPAPPPDNSMVSDPAKLIRLGTMIQTLMNEVRGISTDESGRKLLARIHAETMEELGTVLSADLMDELSEFVACCDADGVPSESEIRVAQAQLVGWLQGLLQGLQASMVAQQAAAVRQLRELQTGSGVPGQMGEGPSVTQHTGTYL